MFKTPRLLVELKVKETWVPIQIYCQYDSVRTFLNVLPRLRLVRKYGIDSVRIKHLATHDQIAEAKLAIYKQNHEY